LINFTDEEFQAISDVIGCWMGSNSISRSREREIKAAAQDVCTKIYEHFYGAPDLTDPVEKFKADLKVALKKHENGDSFALSQVLAKPKEAEVELRSRY
jgi:hypothetical protein